MSEPARQPQQAKTFTVAKLATFRERIDKQEGKVDADTLALLEAEYTKKRAEVAAAEGVSEEEIEARVHAELYGDDELVAADDAVIGRAFRASLWVIGAIALVAALVVVWLNWPEPVEEEVAIETAAPQSVEVGEATAPEVSFADVTAASGIDFAHYNGAYGDKLLPETMGGGGAFFDHDDDGDQDLLMVNSAPWPHRSSGDRPTQKLYLNDGSGRFTDGTAAAGLADVFYGQGVAVGDYDNDGDPDLFFTAVGANRLYENRDGRYTEVTATAGVAGEPEAWSTAAAFFDYDNDGDLDLYVANYVRWSREIDFEVDYRLTGVGRAYGPPSNYEGAHSYLYRNEGDGTFTDVSAAAGIEVANPATGDAAGKALGLAPVDVDEDGWIDLMVANDTVGNFFFHNNGDGTFEEVGADHGLAYDNMGNATGAMGIDVAHFRNDADLGFVIGNFANEMTSLYVSQGDPTLFADEAIGEGIGAPSRSALSFGIFLFDYDLDGRLDVLQTNGHLEEEISSVDPSQRYRQPVQLFWNAGDAGRSTFVEVDRETVGDLAEDVVGRGSAYADVDGDGDLDVALFQVGEPALIFENDQQLGHHWLRVKLEGDPAAGSNRDAIGARLELTVGGETLVRQVNPTKSYLSQSELPVTFGLGEAEAVDGLKVVWPNGDVQEVAVPGVDRVMTVRQGA
ncbi:MAG TPA: CRTAC1 family protein [Thermoanaerobaculia bacterium]|nr:CRTAC1 family protein [Thermoanaerobaculia bacterium]